MKDNIKWVLYSWVVIHLWDKKLPSHNSLSKNTSMGKSQEGNAKEFERVEYCIKYCVQFPCWGARWNWVTILSSLTKYGFDQIVIAINLLKMCCLTKEPGCEVKLRGIHKSYVGLIFWVEIHYLEIHWEIWSQIRTILIMLKLVSIFMCWL